MNQTDICFNRHKGNAASVAANPAQSSKHLTKAKILELLAVNGQLTGKEIAVLLGKDLHKISGRLSDLKAEKLIRGIGLRRDGAEILERVK